MISSTFLILLGVVFIIWKVFTRRKGPYPPGPRGIPIFGNLIQAGAEQKPYLMFTKWAKIYGKIFSLRLGSEDVIVLTDPKLMKEMFNDPAFSGRPQNALFTVQTQGPYGVIISEGEAWEAQRRFTLRHLRDFGFGKNYMEDLIMEEVKEVIEYFKKEEGQPISLHRRFSLALLNSLWRISSGKRLAHDDPALSNIAETLMNSVNEATKSGLLFFTPWVRHFAPELSGWNSLKYAAEKTRLFYHSTVEEHKKTMTDGEPRDFIDNYLQEIKKTTDPKSSFYQQTGQKHLEAIVGDFFIAGSETTSNTMNWTVLYLISHPQIQEKLHQEIDNVVGKSRLPSLVDKPQMPYTEAIIMEVMRISSLVPMGVFQTALQDKEFQGYLIPKGTWIIPNMYGVHHDKEIWGDPEEFRPERFLSEDGKTVKKHEALVPFQIGKRQCLGEPLAKDSLFLFITSIFQRFDIFPESSNCQFDFETDPGFVRAPRHFKVIMKDRLE